MINVVIVEDNKNIREGLAVLINGTPDFNCTGFYSDCESFLEELSSISADVVLMDIGLPGMNGIEGVKRAKQIDPELNILMLTVYEENEIVYDALCAGACGYLVKKTPPLRLLEAIREIYEGGSPMSSQIARKVINTFQKSKAIQNETTQFDLTSREKDVLQGLVDGSNYQEISDTLFISIDTVRHHIRNIYRKLHVHSQTQAVAKAIRKGLL
jgi:DNA-binding NarL/FixJ family response regulator